MENLSQEPVVNQEEVISNVEQQTEIQATITTPEMNASVETTKVKEKKSTKKVNIEKDIETDLVEPKKTKTAPKEKVSKTKIISPPESENSALEIENNNVVVDEVFEAVVEKQDSIIEAIDPIDDIKEIHVESNVIIAETVGTHEIFAEPLIDEVNETEETEELYHEMNDVELEEKYSHLTKEELIEMLSSLVQEENINSIKTKVSLIKVAFLKILKEERLQIYEKFIEEGGVKEDFVPVEDEIETRFKAAFDIYRERKNKYNEEQEKIKLVNLSKKQQIIEELKVLISSEETLKRTYDDFKVLQEKWKEIGQVPHGDNNTLWQNYHFLIEKFFDKVKINKELKDLDLRKNMECKIQLCEKAEELLIEPSIIVSFKKLQEYHDEWKETGPVPLDKKDEIWERFKTASDQINQRRHEFYETQHKQEENNLIAKTALCDKAEQILTTECNSLKEWQDATNELNDLLKIWKTVGQAPKKQNNEIWARFKTYLDTFFANKNDFFGKVKDEQQNNYNLKVELCLQAEAVKDSNDWKYATTELLNLQKQWKEIGPVPRKQQDKLWVRFRAACDEFFKNKADFFSHINENEASNLKLKEELIEKIKAFQFGEDRNANLQLLKDFQREWSEIGHIPIKEKEKVQAEFRKVINNCFEQLKISNSEASAISYRSRVENMKENGDGRQMIGKEKIFISSKIMKLKEDIHLWENNIGFFAHSKQTNILKDEFAKKIENAKQEVILLEAKFKMLTNS
jgi:hypothetical protein